MSRKTDSFDLENMRRPEEEERPSKLDEIMFASLDLGELPFREKVKILGLSAEEVHELVSQAMSNPAIAKKAEDAFNLVNSKRNKPPKGDVRHYPHIDLEDIKKYLTVKNPTGRSFYCLDQVFHPLLYIGNPKKFVAKSENTARTNNQKIKELTDTLLSAWLAESQVSKDVLIHLLVLSSVKIDPSLAKIMKDYAEDLPVSLIEKAIARKEIQFKDVSDLESQS